MRSELQAILWVIAIVTLGWGVLNGTQTPATVGSDQLDDGLAATSAIIDLGGEEPIESGSSKRSVIASAVQSDRLLFPAGLTPPVVASAVPPALDPWDDLVLRGIIQNGADIQAVLAIGTEASGYVVAKVGGAVLDGVVVEIGTDHVVLRMSDGRIRQYPLRGAGEAG